MQTRKIRNGIVVSLIFAFVVMLFIALYADVPNMLAAFAGFHWIYLPVILGLTLVNYAGRFVKWSYYLKRLRIVVRPSISLLIFLSGLSMAITPGKIGELLKSYMLRQYTDAPISHSSPIIVAERLSDGLAMLALASSGLLLYRFGLQLMLPLLVVGLVGVLVIQNRTLSLRLLRICERLPFLGRFALHFQAFYESAYALLQWRPLLLAVGIGIVSWSGECLAFYFVFRGLGIAASMDLALKSTFILAVSSLVGSASGLPGGLGSADGSVLGLTRLLVTPSSALGGAATLLIRFCTLWFGLLIGVGALITLRTVPALKAVPRERAEDDRLPDSQSFSIAHQSNADLSSVSATRGE